MTKEARKKEILDRLWRTFREQREAKQLIKVKEDKIDQAESDIATHLEAIRQAEEKMANPPALFDRSSLQETVDEAVFLLQEALKAKREGLDWKDQFEEDLQEKIRRAEADRERCLEELTYL